MQTSLKKWLSVGAATAMAVLGTSVALPSAAFADDSGAPTVQEKPTAVDCSKVTGGFDIDSMNTLSRGFYQAHNYDPDTKTPGDESYDNQVWINYATSYNELPSDSLFGKGKVKVNEGNQPATLYKPDDKHVERKIIVNYDPDNFKDNNPLPLYLDATLLMSSKMVECINKAWPYLDKENTTFYMFYQLDSRLQPDSKVSVQFDSNLFKAIAWGPGTTKSDANKPVSNNTFNLAKGTTSFVLKAQLNKQSKDNKVTLTFRNGASGYSVPKDVAESIANSNKGKQQSSYDYLKINGHIEIHVAPDYKAINSKIDARLSGFKAMLAKSLAKSALPDDLYGDIEAYDPIDITFVTPTRPTPDLPQIQPHDQVACVGQTFNALEGVTAKDKADGDLTKSVTADLKNVDLSKPGTYTVVYSVTNSHKLTNNRTAKVTVKKCGPQKPTAKPAASGKTAVPAKPATAKPELARTGSATLTLSIASFAMLILGGSVLTLRRRRLS